MVIQLNSTVDYTEGVTDSPSLIMAITIIQTHLINLLTNLINQTHIYLLIIITLFCNQ